MEDDVKEIDGKLYRKKYWYDSDGKRWWYGYQDIELEDLSTY